MAALESAGQASWRKEWAKLRVWPHGCLGDGGSVGVTVTQSAQCEARVAGEHGVGGRYGGPEI